MKDVKRMKIMKDRCQTSDEAPGGEPRAGRMTTSEFLNGRHAGPLVTLRQGGLRPPAGRRPAVLVARQKPSVCVSHFMSFIGFTTFMSKTL